MNNLNVYLESIYIQEDLKSLIPNMSDGLGKQLAKSIDIKNPDKTAKVVKRLLPRVEPKSGFSKLDKFMDSKFDKFKTYKQLASRILSNSVPGLSKYVADSAASAIVIISMFAKKSEKNQPYEKNLKKNLKEVVDRARKFGEDFDDDYADEEDDAKKKRKIQDIADLSVAWGVIMVLSVVILGIGAGLYGVLVAIGAVITFLTTPTFAGLLLSASLILMLAMWLKVKGI